MSDVPPKEIIIDEDVPMLLSSGALRERFQDEALGEGSIVLILRDPELTAIGDLELSDDDDEKTPFFGCKSLLRIDLSGCPKVTSLGAHAFAQCSALVNVSLPDGLTSLGDVVFFQCRSLEIINIPDSLKEVGDKAFKGCEKLVPSGLDGDDYDNEKVLSHLREMQKAMSKEGGGVTRMAMAKGECNQNQNNC